ncbi:MAG: hypothetical protein ACXADL_11565 [Candidatus Thorarchaeota archaeon]|jgi:hypothetical protein
MSDKPIDMIEKYLERVRVYLTIDSEETLMEIRTHLIEEAETLGQGQLTHGSVMLALERFGDPKNAANEYAGTGRKKAMVPTEYTQPLLRIVLLLIGVTAAFLIGSFLVGLSLPELSQIGTPFVNVILINIPIWIGIALIYAVLIVGGLTAIEDSRSRPPTEKTVIERIMGIGSGAFQPKKRSDAIGDLFFGTVFGIALLTPQIQILFNPVFVPVLTAIAVLMFLGAIKGASYLIAGENNLNLVFEAGLSFVWILLLMVIVNTGFPLEYVWTNSGSGWELVELAPIFADIPPLEWFTVTGLIDQVWRVVIFIIAVVSIWQIFVAAMKIPMYLNAGRGWWWQGSFGTRKRAKWRNQRRRRSTTQYRRPNESSNYQDGYLPPDDWDEQ